MSNVYTPALKGVHIDVSLPITRLGQKESFQDVEFLEIRFVNNRLSDQLVVYTADKIKLTDNIVSVVIPDTDSSRLQLGFYDVQFTYRKTNVLRPNQYEPFKLVVPAFSLVATTAELGVDVATDVEVQSVVINGELFIARDGLNGASAFQIAAAHGFEGDEAEWLYSLKKPALDAATAAAIAANEANDAADAADAATSELNTVMQLLAQSESGRVQAEQDRVNAESSRQQAEESRNIKEGDRNQAETAREQAETGRVQAEQGRSSSEQAREQSESIRANSENARQQAETNRSTTETARSQAEQARSQAETARTQAESGRETAENARTEAEQSRKTAETARTQAEQTRGTTFTQKIQESEQATAAANTAAEQANVVGLKISDDLEPALAEVLNNLHGRIVAFEQLIRTMIFRSLQIDNLDVVKNLTIHGSTNLFLTGVTAPVNLPDFAGQYYIDTAGRVGYLALSESVWLKIADAVEVAANSADMASVKNNQEPAMAEIINHLNARILALESIIKNGLFRNTQIDTADIVKSLNLYGGTNLILIRTVAPAEVPDFIGQTYINTAAGVAYEAVGTASVSHWKQKTN